MYHIQLTITLIYQHMLYITVQIHRTQTKQQGAGSVIITSLKFWYLNQELSNKALY